MAETLLQTTVVGSYPQPDWLVDRKLLAKGVPRTRLRELWRVAEPFLEQAQDDATLLAIRDMERAGIDIITDGEMRRESYSNHFATALEGIDLEHPGEVQARSGVTKVPRVVGKIKRTRPVEVRDMQFLRASTDRQAKITLPGPFTMGQQVKDDFYNDPIAMCMDYAAAVNEEAHELVKAGADVIQLDEPWLRNNPDEAKRYAVKVINRALEGIASDRVRLHVCWGNSESPHDSDVPLEDILPIIQQANVGALYLPFAGPRHAHEFRCFEKFPLKSGQILVAGVIDPLTNIIEHPEVVSDRIERIVAVIGDASAVLAANDCGFDTSAGWGRVAPDVVWAKLRTLRDGARLASARLF